MATNLVFCGGQKEQGKEEPQAQFQSDVEEEHLQEEPANPTPVFTLHSVHSAMYLVKWTEVEEIV